MALTAPANVVILVLSLMVQGINLAAGAYTHKVLNELKPYQTDQASSIFDRNVGIIWYVIIAAVISSILYFILIIRKTTYPKGLRSWDLTILILILVLQFGIATIASVSLSNNKEDIDDSSIQQAALSGLTKDFNVTNPVDNSNTTFFSTTTAYTYLSQIPTVRNLTIIALFLTYMICFVGGVAIYIWEIGQFDLTTTASQASNIKKEENQEQSKYSIELKTK